MQETAPPKKIKYSGRLATYFQAGTTISTAVFLQVSFGSPVSKL